MDKTIHYNLNKPTYNETADIATLNENADIIDAALAEKVDKEADKQLSTEDYTTTEKTKLAGIAANANNYTHPATHPPSIVAQNASNRFVADTEKAAWNAKETPSGAQTKADAAENNAKAYAGDKTALLTTDKSTIVAAVNELFTSVSDGKQVIASAITDKGVPASGSDTFAVLADKIEDIPIGGGGEYGTATAAEVLTGYTIGTEGGVVYGTLALTGNAGAAHVLSGKTFYSTNAKSKLTGQIPSKAAQTYTPGTSNQTIAANQYLTGIQTIAGSANLVAANIKSGVSIFGVAGSLVGNPGKYAYVCKGAYNYLTLTPGTQYVSAGALIFIKTEGVYRFIIDISTSYPGMDTAFLRIYYGSSGGASTPIGTSRETSSSVAFIEDISIPANYYIDLKGYCSVNDGFNIRFGCYAIS